MTYRTLSGALLATVIFGCSNGADESPMPGMTAEEHARMQAGGTQGEMDSTGAVTRQPVHLTPEQRRALGVVYTTVRRENLTRTIRTIGRIDAPEPNIYTITPKIDGFIDKLFVTFTGESVRKGQPLLTIYSPTLVAAQEELLTAKRLASQVDRSAGEAWEDAQSLLRASRRRLEYWDITAEQIESLESSGEVAKTLTLTAPASGIVLEKAVNEGQRVTPGMQLYRVADLTEVWVESDVFEQDLQFVHVGSQAHIEVPAYPGQHIMGRVSFVHPTIDELSRTNKVRVTVPNPDMRLKPGMYATTYFDASVGAEVVAVLFDAVVVTGERNLVFVHGADEMLTPREVVLGAHAGELVEILSGLSVGETIVASANFLVDAESRLATTGGDMPGHAGHGTVLEPEVAADTAIGHRHD